MTTDLIVTLGVNKKVSASYNGFTINSDQSIDAGGDASAPEPFSLFLASIGTCAGFFVSMFCQKRNISTEGIRLIQKMQWNEETHTLTDVSIDIEVPSSFPEKYYDAVIKSANQCSVKRAITNNLKFEVKTIVK